MSAPNPRESKFRLPTKPTKMVVTPEMAADWLEYRNTEEKNRRISDRIALRYSRTMQKKGGWKETHQGLAFDTEGWVTDGQTRLRAIQLAGATPLNRDGTEVRFWVHPNEPRDVFDVLDTGRRRQASQLIHKKHPAVLAGAVRFVVIADRQFPVASAREARNTFMDNTEILTWVREYGIDLEWAVAEAVRISTKTGIPASAHAAVLFQAKRSPFHAMVPEWISALESGAIGSRDDPRLRLREAFATATKRASSGRTRSTPYALIAKAWTRYVRGSSVSQLMWRGDELVPTVPGFTPTGDAPLPQREPKAPEWDGE